MISLDDIRDSWVDRPICNPGGGTRPPKGTNVSLSMYSNPRLHANLMRCQEHRNPHDFFEVVNILCVGSMSSVAKVKKKDFCVGGSARAEFVDSIHLNDISNCFSLPFLRSIFKICAGNKSEYKKEILLDAPNSSDSSKHSDGLLQKCSSLIIYNQENIYYALKSIHMGKIEREAYRQELKNEVEILKTLDHPNIVRLIETFQHDHHLYMLMELCSGGDLYSRDPYTEVQASSIVNSIVSAVAYMHSCDITHRDLRFENIVFADFSPEAEIQIIDFGLSKSYLKGDVLHDKCGTIYTMAPEVLQCDYTQKADVWSIGVLAFMLLSSSMPFYGKRRKNVIAKILKGDFSFDGRRWNTISPNAKSFVQQMLQSDPMKRPTAEMVSQHLWLKQQEFDTTKNESEIETMDFVQAALRNFAGYGTLKKLALMIIAHKSTSKELGFLRTHFSNYDKEKNGVISLPEFEECVSPYGYTHEEIVTMFQGIDLDGTGIIHYSEFLAATIEARGGINEGRIAEAFDRLDSDNTGYITTQNLRDFIGQQIPMKYIDEIIHEANITHDHKVNYEDFLSLWNEEGDYQRQASLHEVVRRRLLNSPATSLNTFTSIHSFQSTSVMSRYLTDNIGDYLVDTGIDGWSSDDDR